MVRSWDVFDTLITRRCVQPQRLFDLVERKIKVHGFARTRIAADQMLSKLGREFRLDEIYDVLLQLARVDSSIVDRWKQIEIDTELEQAIPIVENINQVRSGDVLITDMYLPENVIRRLLEKCGLSVPVELIVSSHGKASGEVWQQIRSSGEYVFHTGDNEHADIVKPREYDFDSSYTILSRPTSVEAQLLNVDFEFGTFLRELRLANPFVEEIKRRYWSAFVINVGLLMVIAQLIDRVQKAYGFEYLGFCGRDTYYLRQIYRRWKSDRNESETPNDYLWYSRKLAKNCTADMVKYFADRIKGRRALMIDLYGTGASFNRLRSEGQLKYLILECFWVKRSFSRLQLLEALKTLNADEGDFCLIDLIVEPVLSSDILEPFNRATHNSPIRLKSISVDGKIIPALTFSEINDSENLDVFEACLARMMQSKIRWAKSEHVDQSLSLLKFLMQTFGAAAQPIVLQEQHKLNGTLDMKLEQTQPKP